MISIKDISQLDQLKETVELEKGAHHFWPEFCLQVQKFLQAEQLFVFAHQAEKISRVAGSAESLADEHWLTLTRSAIQHTKPILHKAFGLRVAQKITIPGEDTELILVAGWSGNDPALESERLFRFRIGAQLPEQYQRNRTLGLVRADVTRLAQVLELISRLQLKQSFTEAVLESCNFLASKMNATQVGIGWLEQDQVVLVGINHQPQLMAGSGYAHRLEQVMTEAFAFDEEVCLHTTDPEALRNRFPEHRRLLQEKETPTAVVSMPLHHDGKTLGVLYLERDSGPFQESDLWLLRLYAEHIAFPLERINKAAGGIRARIRQLKAGLMARFHGEKSARTLMALAAVPVLLLLVFLFPLQYRVDANFILRTDSLKVVTSPFDGYLLPTEHRSGDAVSQGQVVAALDIRELLLEQAEAVADLQRQQRESSKARAAGALADMQIALAQVEQARSRLSKIRYRIEGSEIKAPFDSILVEGDLAQLSGSPVRQGEVLLKLASLSDFYFELEADERVIQDLTAGMNAEIRFVTRPDEVFRLELEKIIPVAEYKEGKNLFRIRATFAGDVPDWWRPGMSGLAKVDAGKRPVFWLLFHNLIDSFLMKFWW